MIPLCDLKQQYNELEAELKAALLAVAAAGHYIMGPNVKAFETEMAAYLGCAHSVGVGNGTDALHLALRALDIGPGDEVITTPFTFIATTEAIQMAGAKPVFVDIDPATFNLDATLIADAITVRTKAIMPVHLYGRPCDMHAVMNVARTHNLRVVEDCAQSIGATFEGQHTGTFGDAGCLSFFPSKNLGCMGDGGMIVTNDETLHRRVEILRRHGGKVKYYHSEMGVNSRLDELQAAILRVKLPHLDAWNRLRHDAAARYNQMLPANLIERLPLLSDGRFHSVFHQYTMLTAARSQIMERLSDCQIGTAIYYPVPLHLQEVNTYLGYQKGDFPHAEHAAAQCMSLPMSPHLTAGQQQAVAAALKTVQGSVAA